MSGEPAQAQPVSGIPCVLAIATLAAGLAIAGCGATSPVMPAAPGRVTTGGSSSASAVAEEPSSRLLSVLQQGWAGYREAFIRPDGRVIDPARGGITTSEAQSYALLRSVWMGDRATFDTAWQWTVSHLQVRGDGLFASLWGTGAPGGGDGVLDHNTASDADTDIALALLFASRRFAAASYHDAALTVLNGLWRHDVVSIDGMNVLTGGDWATAQQSPGPVINPSYFAPYAYRVFAREDAAHAWSTLVDSSYTVLNRCTAATLDGSSSAGLPPNWCAIDRSTNRIVSFPQIDKADDYGYDAFRVMWRVALDAVWNHEQRARDYLTRNTFLRTRWARGQRLDPVYAHDGSVVSGYDDPTVYGGDIGNFVVADPTVAAQIQERLLASFHPGAPAYFGDAHDYFEQNWVWFGLALGGGALPDLDRG